MPIIDLQRRIAEAGRIRIGQQVPTAKGTRPTKLSTFRLTSPDKHRITAAAKLYGGQLKPWEAPSGPQYEIITNTDTLPVIIPPTEMAFSQWYELWSAAGCARRCDGATEQITDGPCLCDPDNRECQIHSRLSVMLKDLPGLGLWRLDTQGWYAAIELQGTVDIIRSAAQRGELLPAVLRLDQRMTRRPGQPTRRYAVPVLDTTMTPGQMLTGHTNTAAAIEPAGGNGLTPVPADDRPIPSIAEQAAAVREVRRGKQLAVPKTGLAPRTREQAAQQTPAAGPAPDDSSREIDTPPAAGHTYDDSPIDTEPDPDQMGFDDLTTITPGEGPLITAAQVGLLNHLLRDAGITGDTRHHYCSRLIKRTITSSKDLTMDEARFLIDGLQAQQSEGDE